MKWGNMFDDDMLVSVTYKSRIKVKLKNVLFISEVYVPVMYFYKL